MERFYAEIALNLFYFITMIYGVYVWKKCLEDDSLQIQPRALSRLWTSLLVVTALLIAFSPSPLAYSLSPIAYSLTLESETAPRSEAYKELTKEFYL